MVGSTISHYRILEKLGEGGMGVVYKAEDTKLKRIVALKFLPPDFTRDPHAKERFIHEAQAASKLQHNNICTIHDVDETDDGLTYAGAPVSRQLFIVMDYYDGETLDKKIAQGPLEIHEAIDITSQIAQGLSQAHELGIIHRDIKPANIMITKNGIVKILDFGLAKLNERTVVTKEGTTLGTIAYMSPEQARGESVDHRTDIWSLGIMMYEMLTGQRPFKSTYEQAIIYSILNEEPSPIQDSRSDIPLDIEQIVSTALTKKVDHRYQHIDELLTDLQVHRNGQRLTTKKVGLKIKRSYWITAIFILAIIVVIIFFKLPSNETTENRKSIAVLPFTNLSDSKEDEYFSDAITEDIITQISKISDLKVISRTSVMQYKGLKKSLVDIGNELDVATMLQGSVRRFGNRIRIAGQLIDARTNEHLWAETFDRDMKDVFEIQSDIALHIASALSAKLSVDEKERIEKKLTENLAAYTFYLKGREYYRRYRKQDNESAIGLFKKAIELDSNYSLAYAGIGDAYCERSDMFGFSNEWIDSAIVKSEMAIYIAPNLAEGYNALGHAFTVKGWNHKALEQYRKAVEYNPNYDDAVANIGWTNWYLGRYDETILWLKKSLAYNPTLAFNYFGIGLAYMRLDDRPKAEWWLNETLKHEPDFVYAQLALCYVDIAQKKYQLALEMSRKVFEKFPDDPDVITAVADAQLNPENLKELDRGSDAAFIPYDVYSMYAIKENSQEALKWLQNAIDYGWRNYRFSQQDPLFENLHNDVKFKQMIMQLKISVEQMRKRVEELEKR